MILLCCLMFSVASLAADTTLIQLQSGQTIAGQFSDFYSDNLGNLYLISSLTNQIKKTNDNGDSVAVFNNVLRYGKIYSLDVTNPLKVLVFYKDVSTILILDRFLATRATVDLRKLGITQVKAVAQSYDNNIWLYDEGEGKIKKVDENNNVLLESSDLRLVFDESLSPEKIIDNNGQLYLYDNKLGWLIFDYYTAFKKRVAFPGWKDVTVNDNLLQGRQNSLFCFALPNDINFRTVKTSIPLTDVIKTEWQRNKLYALTNNSLQIFNVLK